MRILVVTNLYPNPYEPNRSTFNRQQVRALAERHDVQVISPIAWPEELWARWRNGRKLDKSRRATCDGIPADHPRYLYTPGFLRGWYGHFYKWSAAAAFSRAVESFGPDIIFAPWAYPDGWAATRLARKFDLPVVIKVHGCDLLVGGMGLDCFPWRKKRTMQALRDCDGVVAVSQDLADHAVALGADRRFVRVVYDGIDTERFHPGPRADARHKLGLDPNAQIILFIGNLIDVKAPTVLVDACAALAEKNLAFICCMIGEGPLRPALERRIETLGLRDRVQLLGPRPHHAIGDWYRAADLFVLPSLSEGVPCVLLEAIACGTPFIASRVGGIPEIAQFGRSHLVPRGDPAALAEAIQLQLVVGHQQAAPPPTWRRSHAKAADEIVELFDRILRSRTASSPATLTPVHQS